MILSWSSRLALLGALAGDPAIAATEVKNVAIIGAGAAGSSAAHHLAKYAEQEGLTVNITIFEKTNHIGGRSITTDAFGDPAQPIELGASIFVTVNHILYNATKEFDIPIGEPYDSEDGDITAIWNGEKIIFETVEGASWWWDVGKMLWNYGLAPYRAVQLVKEVVSKFLQIYEEPHFPFRSLTEKAFELGLLDITGVTGEQFLAQKNINPKFGKEILQAATRVNYASNLAYIHGLETMVSFATDGAVAVRGGNWKIFEQMVRTSGASLCRNTSVASISAVQKRTETPQYIISTTDSNSKASEEYTIAFDNIIIASPWQFSKIEAEEGIIQHTIDEIPYTKLHVTLFTSPLNRYRLHRLIIAHHGQIIFRRHASLRPGYLVAAHPRIHEGRLRWSALDQHPSLLSRLDPGYHPRLVGHRQTHHSSSIRTILDDSNVRHSTPLRHHTSYTSSEPPHKDVYGGPLLISSALLTIISLSTTVPLVGAHPPGSG